MTLVLSTALVAAVSTVAATVASAQSADHPQRHAKKTPKK